MRVRLWTLLPVPGIVIFLAVTLLRAAPPLPAPLQGDLDARVRAFLQDNRWQWRDMNVPAADGQTLHDIVLKGKYTRAPACQSGLMRASVTRTRSSRR